MDNFMQNFLMGQKAMSSVAPSAEERIRLDEAAQADAQQQQAQMEAMRLYNQNVLAQQQAYSPVDALNALSQKAATPQGPPPGMQGPPPPPPPPSQTPVQNYGQLAARQQFTQQIAKQLSDTYGPSLAAAMKNKDHGTLNTVGEKYIEMGTKLGDPHLVAAGNLMKNVKFSEGKTSTIVDTDNPEQVALVSKQLGIELPKGKGVIAVDHEQNPNDPQGPPLATGFRQVGRSLQEGGVPKWSNVQSKIFQDRTNKNIESGMSKEDAEIDAFRQTNADMSRRLSSDTGGVIYDPRTKTYSTTVPDGNGGTKQQELTAEEARAIQSKASQAKAEGRTRGGATAQKMVMNYETFAGGADDLVRMRNSLDALGDKKQIKGILEGVATGVGNILKDSDTLTGAEIQQKIQKQFNNTPYAEYLSKVAATTEVLASGLGTAGSISDNRLKFAQELIRAGYSPETLKQVLKAHGHSLADKAISARKFGDEELSDPDTIGTEEFQRTGKGQSTLREGPKKAQVAPEGEFLSKGAMRQVESVKIPPALIAPKDQSQVTEEAARGAIKKLGVMLGGKDNGQGGVIHPPGETQEEFSRKLAALAIKAGWPVTTK